MYVPTTKRIEPPPLTDKQKQRLKESPDFNAPKSEEIKRIAVKFFKKSK